MERLENIFKKLFCSIPNTPYIFDRRALGCICMLLVISWWHSPCIQDHKTLKSIIMIHGYYKILISEERNMFFNSAIKGQIEDRLQQTSNRKIHPYIL